MENGERKRTKEEGGEVAPPAPHPSLPKPSKPRGPPVGSRAYGQPSGRCPQDVFGEFDTWGDGRIRYGDFERMMGGAFPR